MKNKPLFVIQYKCTFIHFQYKYNFPLSETSKTIDFHHSIYIRVASVQRLIVSRFFFFP